MATDEKDGKADELPKTKPLKLPPLDPKLLEPKLLEPKLLELGEDDGAPLFCALLVLAFPNPLPPLSFVLVLPKACPKLNVVFVAQSPEDTVAATVAVADSVAVAADGDAADGDAADGDAVNPVKEAAGEGEIEERPKKEDAAD